MNIFQHLLFFKDSNSSRLTVIILGCLTADVPTDAPAKDPWSKIITLFPELFWEGIILIILGGGAGVMTGLGAGRLTVVRRVVWGRLRASLPASVRAKVCSGSVFWRWPPPTSSGRKLMPWASSTFIPMPSLDWPANGIYSFQDGKVHE